MADYFLENNCQPEADIDGYLKSQPATIDNGHSYTKSFTAPNVVLHDTDLTTLVTTTQNIQTFSTCTLGTQALTPSGLTLDDKLELTWGMVLIVIMGVTFKYLRRAF